MCFKPYLRACNETLYALLGSKCNILDNREWLVRQRWRIPCLHNIYASATDSHMVSHERVFVVFIRNYHSDGWLSESILETIQIGSRSKQGQMSEIVFLCAGWSTFQEKDKLVEFGGGGGTTGVTHNLDFSTVVFICLCFQWLSPAILCSYESKGSITYHHIYFHFHFHPSSHLQWLQIACLISVEEILKCFHRSPFQKSACIFTDFSNCRYYSGVITICNVIDLTLWLLKRWFLYFQNFSTSLQILDR